MQTYNPTEFLAKLAVNELPNPVKATIFGLVKPNEKSPLLIDFSNSLACEKWLSLPLELVESIEHLKTIKCKDHQHPLVKVIFKQPDEARQDLVFLFGLLSQLISTLSRAAATARKSPTLRGFPDACYVIEVGGSFEICCWTDNELDCGGIV